jgi:hypothetical protein
MTQVKWKPLEFGRADRLRNLPAEGRLHLHELTSLAATGLGRNVPQADILAPADHSALAASS